MIPGAPQIGAAEMLILPAIFMLLFGATHVPDVGGSLGGSMREFRKGATEDPQGYRTRQLDEKKQLPERESARLEEEKTGVG